MVQHVVVLDFSGKPGLGTLEKVDFIGRVPEVIVPGNRLAFGPVFFTGKKALFDFLGERQLLLLALADLEQQGLVKFLTDLVHKEKGLGKPPDQPGDQPVLNLKK